MSYLSRDLEWCGCKRGVLRESNFKGEVKKKKKIRKINQRVTVNKGINACASSHPVFLISGGQICVTVWLLV